MVRALFASSAACGTFSAFLVGGSAAALGAASVFLFVGFIASSIESAS